MSDRQAGEVLDRWLSRAQSEGASLGDFVREEPEDLAAIGQLLETAQAVRKHLMVAAPSASYRKASRIRVLNRARAVRASWTRPTRLEHRKPTWRLAYALASVAIAVVLVASGTGMAYASSEALPGDALYPVKLGLEELQLTLAFNAEDDVMLLGEFAEERLAEAEAAIAAGRGPDAEAALERFAAMVERQIGLAKGVAAADEGGLLDDVQANLGHHLEVLALVQAKAPPAAQDSIGRAIERSSHGLGVIEQLREGGRPSDLAPGRQDEPTSALETPGMGQEPKETKTEPADDAHPGPTKTPDPTKTPRPTETLRPTKTPKPTNTPRPDKDKDKDKGA